MGSPKWFVYIIRSVRGRFYTGISVNPERRLRQHNGEIKGGSRTARAERPWQLVYTEEYATRSEALIREAAIKKLKHSQKIHLCRLIE